MPPHWEKGAKYYVFHRSHEKFVEINGGGCAQAGMVRMHYRHYTQGGCKREPIKTDQRLRVVEERER